MRILSLTLSVLAISAHTSAVEAETLKADVWADNWFKFYLNEAPVAEDRVPITTERSFNEERFTFEAEPPYALNFIVKDFKQDDTGLEYIGSRKQQMGDGGFIAQFKDPSGNLIATTDQAWRCLVVHEAPTSKSCERERNPVAGKGPCRFSASKEPSGWTRLDFDDSSWPFAHEYSERDVRPKDGHDKVRWDRKAKLIWGPDLETNNTLLCRLVVR
ncbi:PEBP family protein [Roseibium sp.]|uniref:PEBP family protein n=1 Tax=Roseibium sp. TaxID=1936156 RepID=UPI003A971272